jgi:hypothetical protein
LIRVIHTEACGHTWLAYARREYRGDTVEGEGVTWVRAARWRLSVTAPYNGLVLQKEHHNIAAGAGIINIHPPSTRACRRCVRILSINKRQLLKFKITASSYQTIFDISALGLANLCIQSPRKKYVQVYNYRGSPKMRCLAHANAVYAETQLVLDPTTIITGTHSRHAQSSSQSPSPDSSRRSRS